MFDKMPQRATLSWNAMISAYTHQNMPREALSLYMSMLSHQTPPDTYTFASLFRAIAGLTCLTMARTAHAHLLVLGSKPNIYVESSLVDMYAKCGSIANSRKIFDSMVQRDVIAWTAMIVGCTQSGLDSEALVLFSEMVGSCAQAPNGFTLASVLIACGNAYALFMGTQAHAFAVKAGLDQGVTTRTSLVAMYAKLGLIQESHRAFEGFLEANVVSWTAMIAGLVQNEHHDLALWVFQDMLLTTLRPNEFTLSTILRACACTALLRAGCQVHSLSVRLGFESKSYTGVALVDMYAKCGCVVEARVLFDGLAFRDVVLMNAMITGYGHNGQAREALQLFKEMGAFGLRPNSTTFVGLLSSCSNAGLLDEGESKFSIIYCQIPSGKNISESPFY
ncbi:hypothetical protein AMTR_s00103p00113040 [Amborella trichopoda]|uniref:Pentacotripeptide-repeat region of PRORP domain-containing protein n=1 Tax=Amborella trichopoda TaxID=13333 RepID=W1NZR6_AMBTC|nr:hypothetical protein AMTR_s00103p00113040 [Amborella trichopoda]